MSVVITFQYLDEHRTERGSWTYMQMSALGVKWPQPPGWRQALEGVEISDEQARAFEAGKFVFSAKTIRKQNAKKVELLKLMGAEIPPELLPPPPMPPLTAKAQRKAEKRAKRKAARLAKAQELERKLAATKAATCKPAKLAKAPSTAKQPPAYSGDVTGEDFLASYQWRRLRMEVLRHYGPRCMCCGATPENGATMNVDHIKPRRSHPGLALEFDNLQVLCGECNHGKGNWDTTDWRPRDERIDPGVAAFIRSIAREP